MAGMLSLIHEHAALILLHMVMIQICLVVLVHSICIHQEVKRMMSQMESSFPLCSAVLTGL